MEQTTPATIQSSQPKPKQVRRSISAGASTKPANKERAKKILPSDRIKFEKQLDILRAFASASIDGQGVTNKRVADLVGLSETTISMGNSFFSDAKFIQKVGGGYAPAPEVVDYKRSLEFTPDTAGQRLAPILSKQWFFQCLRPRLEFNAITEDVAVGELAIEAGAAQHHRQQLRLILDYLVLAGLVIRDNGVLRLAPKTQQAALQNEEQDESDMPDTNDSPRDFSERNNPTAISLGSGGMEYHIDIRVSMSELAGWTPERITAFFAGMAQVIAAKGKLEEGA